MKRVLRGRVIDSDDREGLSEDLVRGHTTSCGLIGEFRGGYCASLRCPELLGSMTVELLRQVTQVYVGVDDVADGEVWVL